MGFYQLGVEMYTEQNADGYLLRPDTDREKAFLDFLVTALRLAYETATVSGAASPVLPASDFPTTAYSELTQAGSRSNQAAHKIP